MKKLTLTFIAVFMTLSTQAVSKLECYEKFHSAIEELDTKIIKTYENLYNAETNLLDQYFKPGKYYNGPHVHFKAERKQILLSERIRYKEWIDQATSHSQNLSRELTACLKYSN